MLLTIRIWYHTFIIVGNVSTGSQLVTGLYRKGWMVESKCEENGQGIAGHSDRLREGEWRMDPCLRLIRSCRYLPIDFMDDNIIMTMQDQIFLNCGDVSAITCSSSSSNSLRNAVDLFSASCWTWFDGFFPRFATTAGICDCGCGCVCNLADCGWGWGCDGTWYWYWLCIFVAFWVYLVGPTDRRYCDCGSMMTWLGVNFYTNLSWLWRCGCGCGWSDCWD